MTDAGLPERFGGIAFVAAAAGLLVVMTALPSGGLFSADSGPKYWQALAFAEGEGFPRGFAYPAADLDPARLHIPRFTAPICHRLTSIYPVLFPLMAAGPLAVAGDWTIRIVPWIAALIAAWILGLIAARLCRRNVTGWVAALVLVATPLAFYSITFWEHSIALAIVVVGLSLVVTRQPAVEQRWQRWALFGALLGVGAWVRTEVGFLFPLLAVPMLPRGDRRGIGTAAIGLASFASGGMVGLLVQRLTIGTWLPIHVTYHADSSFYSQSLLQSRWESILSFIAPHWSCGLATVVWLAALALVLTKRGSTHGGGLALAFTAVGAALVSTFVIPVIRWADGFRPTDAFPFAAPAATWLVVSVLPLVLWRQSRDEVFDPRRLLLVAIAAWLPVAVFASRAVRSFEWGGRLFLPTVVLLTGIMLSFRLAGGPYLTLRKLVVVSAVVLAIGVQGLGLVLLHHGVSTHRGLAVEVEAFIDSNEPVITDAYLLPLIAGREFFDTRFLYCTGQGAVPLLASVFARESVTWWTYGTVLRTPGERLTVGETVVGTDGSRWILVDRLHRRVGSRDLELQRYRRVPPDHLNDSAPSPERG